MNRSPPQGSITNSVTPGSYTVYKDINDSNKTKAKNNFTGVVDYSDLSSRIVLNQVGTALATSGGAILLRGGTYSIDNQVFFGAAGTPTANIKIKGDGLDQAVLKWVGSNVHAQISVYFKCNYSISDLSFDGNSLGFSAFGTDAYPVYGLIERVRVYNCTGVPIVNNGGALGETLRDSWFGSTLGLDTHASWTTEYSIVENNYFDRRTGSTSDAINGPTCTYGGGQNIIVRGNIIKRAPLAFGGGSANTGTAISVEGWHSAGNNNIIIQDNNVEYGKIYVGGQFLTPPPTSTFSRINISNNNVLGGLVQVEAGTNTTPSNEVTDVNIHHNNIQNAFFGGIMLSSVQGPTIIDHNIIHDTNTLSGTGEDRGGIYLLRCRNASVLANTIQMTDVSTNGSPYGIGYDACTNIRLYDNHIINTNTKTAIQATTAAGVNTNILTRNNDINT